MSKYFKSYASNFIINCKVLCINNKKYLDTILIFRKMLLILYKFPIRILYRSSEKKSYFVSIEISQFILEIFNSFVH